MLCGREECLGTWRVLQPLFLISTECLRRGGHKVGTAFLVMSGFWFLLLSACLRMWLNNKELLCVWEGLGTITLASYGSAPCISEAASTGQLLLQLSVWEEGMCKQLRWGVCGCFYSLVLSFILWEISSERSQRKDRTVRSFAALGLKDHWRVYGCPVNCWTVVPGWAYLPRFQGKTANKCENLIHCRLLCFLLSVYEQENHRTV